MKKIFLMFVLSYCVGLTLRAVVAKARWHSHVVKICSWNGPKRNLHKWTHLDEGLGKNKTRIEKAQRCKELGFRPKF